MQLKISVGTLCAKKYELLTGNAIMLGQRRLYLIRALRDFGGVRRGDIGGRIESEDNLSHHGAAWVAGDAWVYGTARIHGDQVVAGNAVLKDNVRIMPPRVLMYG